MSQDDIYSSSDEELELEDLPDPWSVLEGPEGPDASRLPSDDGGSGGEPSRVGAGVGECHAAGCSCDLMADRQ